MWTRRWFFVVSLAIVCLLATRVATPLLAQQNDNKAPSPAATSAQEAEKEKELNSRYARAYLKFVQATLARYEEINRRVPNSIRPGVMQALQDGVAEAKDRVQMADEADPSHSAAYVTSAQAELQRAQSALSKANAANARVAGTVSASEVNRLKAEIELSQIRLEKAQHLAKESPLSNVRYELGQLREDVQELRLNVALLRDRN